MNDTTRDWLLESKEARRLKGVMIERRPPNYLVALSLRSQMLGNLGTCLTMMVWAEHKMDEALDNATSDQRAHFYHQIDPH